MPMTARIIGILLLLFMTSGCDTHHSDPAAPTATTKATTVTAQTQKPVLQKQEPAKYVGSDNCKLCHINQHNEWKASDHHQAMALATPETVQGKFPATLNHHNQITHFLPSNNQFSISTDEKTSSPAELALKYTFGIYPLQQYLTELPGGQLQSLPFAWNSLGKEQGGQNWFHLYANETIFPGDALHWRSNSHNANHMCIECHTTNFQKNISNREPIQFSSTWQEVGVGCESCHGPASNHLAWSNSSDKTRFANQGWDFTLTSGSQSLWEPQTNDKKPRRITAADNNQLEQCAQCHSRRSRIDASNHSGSYFNSFLPSLLDASLYYPDGQILDEVYEYGSFTQSKMYSAGVTCSNCHNPHSGKIRIEGNGLCLQCHNASHDTPAHTLHTPGSPGSACVDCHMTTRTYMQVDKRRDHSFRIPRPTLSASIGTPNACQQCHAGQSTDWAIQTLTQHFGSQITSDDAHYGKVFDMAQKGEPSAFEGLVAILNNPQQAVMIRATAASLLGRFPTRDPRPALGAALGSTEPLIRLGALQACDSLPAQERLLVFPLLNDQLKAVRIEAARLASVIPDVQQVPGYTHARDEYIASQQLNADRAPALVSLGTLAMNELRWQDAESLLLNAIKIEPWYIPASVNLADLYRSQQREADAETLLKNALKTVPENSEVQFSYGLLLVRQNKNTEALELLSRAASNSRDPYPRYVYALALQKAGKNREARKELDDASKLAYSRDVQLARIEIAWGEHDRQASERYFAEWLSHDNQDPAAQHWQTIINTQSH